MKKEFSLRSTIKRSLVKFFISVITAAVLVMSPCLCAVAVDTDSQHESIDYETVFTPVLYDKTSGLPTSEANAIAQSEDGFIWIGGYSGLVRYDGNSFYRYDSSTGISSVVSLYFDSRRRLWIGTNDNGIAVMKGTTFEFYDRDSGLNSYSIRKISEDTNGDIIVATTMGLAYIDKNDELHAIDDPQINKEYVCDLVMGYEGIIYGITLNGMLFTIENKNVTGCYLYENEENGVLTSIFPDPDNVGKVYLGTHNSKVLYGDLKDEISTFKVMDTGSMGEVNQIIKINEDVWLCADKGIGYFYNNSNFHRLDNTPMNNSVDCMMMDYEMNMWFCSSRQGVMKCVPNRFFDVFHAGRLDAKVVNATCLSGEDLYCATDSGLLVIDSKYNLKKNKLTELLEGIRIRCIKKDSTGKLWLCTYSSYGLICYDPEKDSYINFNEEKGILSNRVRMVQMLSNGSVAVATSGGVNIISNGKVTASYGREQGINNPEILSIAEAPDGRLYFGSDGDGIYVFDGKKVARLGHDDGLRSEVILRITKDPSEDLYWIITSNSIGYMRDDKITTINNFPYSNNFDVYFDDYQRLWVLSSNGIYVVKKSDMLKDEKIDYMLYDMNCGLPSAATVNSYSEQSDNGDLYIASSTGVNRINVNDTLETNSKIRLGIPYVTVDDELMTVPDNKEIVIPADCKRITIYANAFTYSLNNPHMQYYLEGFEDTPISVTKQDMEYITYTNLRGGTYTFHLSIIDTMTGKVEKSVNIRIIKSKAIYETLWFRIVTVIAAGLIMAFGVMLYFRIKTKKLIKEHEKNKKLVNEMTNAFAKCVDMKDAYTNGHSFRVAQYTAKLARKLGKSEDEIEKIYSIALLHDIGKISIPDNILNKPGRLNDEEYKIMKSHSQRGYEILKEITIAPELAIGAGSHHERIDGKGYPNGLKGDEIPEIGRMIAVADTFDAMYSTRPYRKKMKLEDVVAEIKRCSGTQLSPEVVDACLALIEEGDFLLEEEAPVCENNLNPAETDTAVDKDKKDPDDKKKTE